jgi:ABC-2 type transport system permease protein
LQQPEAPAGSIYDLGYRRYDGLRRGRGYAVWALYLASLRSAFGIGRRPSSKVIPVILTVIMLLPAVIELGIVAVLPTGKFTPVKPENYFDFVEIIVALFCAAIAPEMVGRDQRNRTLSLYFSRALTRTDYAIAKMAALVTAIAGLMLAPDVILIVGNILSVDDPTQGAKDNLDQIVPILLSSFLVATTLAALSLAVASQTSRRAFGTGGILALFVIPTALVGIFVSTVSGLGGRLFIYFNIFSVVEGAVAWLFRVEVDSSSLQYTADFPVWTYVVAALAWAVVGLAIVLRRYETVGT